MWDDLLRALALMLVIEGALPFLAPQRWRQMVATISQIDNRTLRIIGIASMLAGVILLFWIRELS